MMLPPPFEDGGLKETVSDPLPVTIPVMVGAPAGPTGVALSMLDAGPVRPFRALSFT